MSEHSTEMLAETERLSRRMALQYQELMGRIIALENEVRALKGEPQPGREVYPDAREINWCAPLAAGSAIARIMQR